MRQTQHAAHVEVGHGYAHQVARLELVRHAWALLLEPVPESFY